MNHSSLNKKIAILLSFILVCCTCYAKTDLYVQARGFQRNGNFDEAIKAYSKYLSQPINETDLDGQKVVMYTEALLQLMNTFQSKGEPEACVTTLQELFYVSPFLQKYGLRDYYSVMGYALSRTDRMKEAEETILKALDIPLFHATPERYFRDYAYAAAVFYSNPDYQEEVIAWCEKALEQAELCVNTSGKQWVTAMLGSLYKRSGNLNKAIKLFRISKEEALKRNDDLGVLNSLQMFVDFLLYWNAPEYANLYASEAIQVEEGMTTKNPMVSAQAYINKGRALLQLGETDSVSIYVQKAKEFCKRLPYNSGMVDVDLLHGTYLTEKGGDDLHIGIQELQRVTKEGTDVNRAKAYHQLVQTYLTHHKHDIAEEMLDSMYSLLDRSDSRIYIHIDYQPILDHYMECKNQKKVELYTRMMLQEQRVLNEKKLNFNIIETITETETQTRRQSGDSEIIVPEQADRSIWFIVYITITAVVCSAIAALLFHQKKRHRIKMQQANDNLEVLVQKLNQTNAEKEMISQNIDEIMNDKENRQKLETLTPSVLQKNGESKFRQRFELLYPLFLPRLREKVPSITRREELLAMLILLKQDNKEIADLFAIAPRSVLMLRHRFRKKIGMTTDKSLEDFIEETSGHQNNPSQANETDSDIQ